MQPIEYATDLSMDQGSNCHIPCGIRGHHKAQEWPNSVVVKWGNEDSCCTACTKDVGPGSLV